jgi:2-polyprenyl-3-methyl-5-hydroxy-6-metoxy-1,4-benzoquinol methylase
MNSEPEDHWTRVYEQKAPSAVSWFQPEPEPSLCALDHFGARPSNSLIDVGGGASNLVDALLRRGWTDLTILDIAAPALQAARERLGRDAQKVDWEVADVTEWKPSRQYDVWHDRAVFHFLTEEPQRAAYRRALLGALVPRGLLIIATFALDGPEKCSGLPVQRYGPESLARAIGDEFEPIESWHEEHVTPWGATQSFNWCGFRRRN